MEVIILARKTKASQKNRIIAFLLTFVLVITSIPLNLLVVFAASGTALSAVESIEEDSTYDKENTKTYLITTTAGEKVRVVFYKNDMFRIWLANNGKGEFTESASELLLEKEDYGSQPQISLEDRGGQYELSTSELTLVIEKDPFIFALYKNDGQLIWRETEPINYSGSSTAQLLGTNENEYFFGCGQQMGSVSHKGKVMKIQRGGWTEGGTPSAVPFYMSTDGFGVFRNTFQNGSYDFTSNFATEMTHYENRFDAFYFYGPSFGEVLDGYTELTGRPSLIPRWGLGLGDASAYRQQTDTMAQGGNPKDSSEYKPEQQPYGGFWHEEKATVGVVDDFKAEYIDKDMPLAWMLPNDGYGCEYNKETHPGGSLGTASEGLMENGIRTGLWVGQPSNYTKENYTHGYPKEVTNKEEQFKYFDKEIKAQTNDWGVRLYKIDVAWSGQYNNEGVMREVFKRMYNNIEETGDRGFLISVYGWAGGQKYATIWSGDQSGDSDYVRYHIPSFTGASMSGYPYSTSDQGAIFTDQENVYIRDLQMKTLVPTNYVMNNWGSTNAKGVATANKRPGSDRFTEEEQEINRKYLKLKQQLVPYLYSYARGSYDTGAPIVRPMVYNFQNDPATYDNSTQYQYMSGDWFLVAPVYDVNATRREDIYLPEGRWIDYWTGKEYFGPATISYDAPLDTLPLFVKGGAIVPMYQEHLYDNQQEYNGKNVFDTMIFDLYPEGTSEFTLYEDDGASIKYKTENAYTETLIKTVAPARGIPGPLAITIGAAEGNGFEGQVSSRKNLMIIHTAVKPKTVRVGSSNMKEFASYAELEASQNGGWYFGKQNAEDKNQDRLFVKTPSISTSTIAEIWVDKYLANDGYDLEVALPYPENIKAEGATKGAVKITWDEVSGAEFYDIQVDGVKVIDNVKSPYLHTGLHPEEYHTYRVRARNKTQKSGWSEPIEGLTLEDPDKWLVTEMDLLWNKGVYDADYVANAIDGNLNTKFHSYPAVNGPENFDVRFNELHLIDKFEYCVRENMGNGSVKEYRIFTSLDGINYTEVNYTNNPDRTWSWTYGGERWRTVEFEPVFANYFRFQKVQSVGDFFCIAEMKIHRTHQNIEMTSLSTNKPVEASSQWQQPVDAFENITGLSASAKSYKSEGGHIPAFAIDGNPDTAWRMREVLSGVPADEDRVLQIHLPSIQEVSRIVYHPPEEGTPNASGAVTSFGLYAIDESGKEVWLSGGDWEADGGAKTVNFRTIKAKSLKFIINDAVDTFGAVAEFEAYGPSNAGTNYQKVEIDRSTLKATASGDGPSTVEEVPAPEAIDGDKDTFHQTAYATSTWNKHWPAYFTIELPEPKTITQIDYVARLNGSGALRGYDVYYSHDGENFFRGGTGIAENSKNGNVVQLTYDYPYPVKYIRISSAFKEELLNEPFVERTHTGPSVFAYNVGDHLTAAEITLYEDPELTALPSNERYAEITGITVTANRTASGSDPARIVDGNPNTFWESEYSTSDWENKWKETYVTFDLGGLKKVSQIEYLPRQNSSNGRLRGYKVLYSKDGVNFYTDSVGYAWDNTKVQRLNFEHEEAVRYIRIQSDVFGEMETKLNLTNTPEPGKGAYAWGSGNQLAIAGVKIYEDKREYQSGTGDAEPYYDAKYATNPSLDTGWSSADGQEAQLTVDLEEILPIDFVRLVWGKEYGKYFDIEVSTDGSSWEVVQNILENNQQSAYYALDEIEARYVRMNGKVSNGAYTVRAFDVFGPTDPSDIEISKTEATMGVGGRIYLSANVLPAGARDKTVIWSSSDENIAHVNYNGVVDAISGGKVEITAATSNGFSQKCTVTVEDRKVTEITLDKTEWVMGIGEMLQVEAAVQPENPTNSRLQWQSSDEDVATVSSNGFVTGKVTGSSTVTASSTDGSEISADLYMQIVDITEIAVDNTAGTIEISFDKLPSAPVRTAKELYKVVYKYTEDGEAKAVDIYGMEKDENSNKVKFKYTPLKYQGEYENAIIEIQYKNGQVYAQEVTLQKVDGAKIRPETIYIGINDNPQEKTVKIDYLEDCDLSGIEVNGVIITADEDYTVSDNVVIFQQAYIAQLLSELPEGTENYKIIYSFTGEITPAAGEFRFIDNVIEAEITSVEAENGSLTITLDKAPVPAPKSKDFLAEIRIDSDEWTELEIRNLVYDKELKTVTFDFTEIPPADDEQAIQIRVQYKEGSFIETKEALIIPAIIYPEISEIAAVNGQITIILAEKPTYEPNQNLFSLSVGDDPETAMTDYSYDGDKTVVINFEPVARQVTEQTIQVAVSYNQGTAHEAQFTVFTSANIGYVIVENGTVAAILDAEPEESNPESLFEFNLKLDGNPYLPGNLTGTYYADGFKMVYKFDKIQDIEEPQTLTAEASYNGKAPVSKNYTIPAMSPEKLSLKKLIEMSETVKGKGKPSTVSEEEWNKFAELLENAKAVFIDGEAIDSDYKDAHDALKPVMDRVMKSDLKSIIEIAASLNQSQFTSGSWNKLQNAVASANAICNSNNATPSEVAVAAAEIENAIDGLVDVSQLKGLITKAEEYDSNKYTESSWEQLVNALNNAKYVAGNGSASREDVNKAADALSKAISNLSGKKGSQTSSGSPAGSGKGSISSTNKTETVEPELIPQGTPEDLEKNLQSENPLEIKFADAALIPVWAREAVTALTEKNVISGRTNGNFDPSGNVTRAEFVIMTVNGFGFKKVGEAKVFSDVPQNAWYKNAVDIAVSVGIISGMGDDIFAPEKNISRQDLCVILYNSFKKLNVPLSDAKDYNFADNAEIAAYAKEAVYTFRLLGIINGRTDGSFDPNANATRAEAAVMIHNALKYYLSVVSPAA